MALTGLSGSGKSELAKEYAHQTKDRYEFIGWIAADTQKTMMEAIEKIASSLELPKNTNASDLLYEFKKTLYKKQRWLLIFDNANDEESCSPFIPKGGDILITSQNKDWKSILHVRGLSHFETRSYFDHFPHIKNEEAFELERLSYLLEGSPLAMTQAIGHMKNEGLNIREYIQEFHRKSTPLLQVETALTDHKPIYITINSGLDQLQKKSRIAYELLLILTLFPNIEIPSDFIIQMITSLNFKNRLSKRDVIIALDELKNLYLIEAQENKLELNKIIHIIASIRINTKNKSTYLMLCLNELEGVSKNYELTLSILFHIITQIKTPNHELIERLSEVFFKLWPYFHHANPTEVHQAEKALEEMLMLQKQIHIINNEKIAITLQSLAVLQRDMGKPKEAKENMDLAIKIFNRICGENSILAGNAKGRMGNILRDLHQDAAAEKMLNEAIEVQENEYGKYHASVALSRNDYGKLLRDTGKFKEAKEQLELVLEIHKEVSGELKETDHARAMANLGTVLIECHEYDEAIEIFKKALKIFSELYSKPNYIIAITTANLAKAFQKKGDTQTAITTYKKSISILRILEVNHKRHCHNKEEKIQKIHNKIKHCQEKLLELNPLANPESIP